MQEKDENEDNSISKNKKRKISIHNENEQVPKIMKTAAEPDADAGSESKQEPVQDELVDKQTEQPAHAKRHKRRKRHYFNAIRAQMEFYFGDANLTKDRFLKKLILQDPFVPLEIFMTFNKMKTLSKSVEEIAKSLSNSQLLELDEHGLKVRRKTNLPEERNVDEKTVYVESLPATATHDWVRQVFERFGPVAYVSLPKYAKSHKIKEFAFVEFENEASVRKAVLGFKEFNGVLQIEDIDPAELTSVTSYVKEQSEHIKQEEAETSDDKVDNKRKRKKCKSSIKAGEPIEKRIKKEVEDSELKIEPVINTQSCATSDIDNDKKKDAKSNDADITEEQCTVDAKKKRLKKKKKAKSAKERKRDTELTAEATYFELKILPKRDWKRLRNKYLNLQRQKVGELKRKVWRERQEQQQQQQTHESTDDDYAESEAKKCKSKLNAGMNMNFYGAGDDETQLKTAKQNPALERPPLFSYEPGLIVEVSLLEPCVNVKEFKANMKQYPVVKYVDIKEGSMTSHLRIESATGAEQFVARMNSAEHGCKVLTGETETAYWQKIEKDREAKLNKQVKLPQKRGREKIKKLITQHIHFGDEE